MTGLRARRAAAVVAATAWIGVGLQVATVAARNGSVTETVWILSRYFTILTNLAIAAAFTGLAAGRSPRGGASLMGGLTLAILLVGAVYNLLLSNLGVLRGADLAADVVVHCVTPVLVPLFWLACVPKGELTRGGPWRWAVFPLAYLAYALVRGHLEQVYAYPFINVPRIGWTQAGINVASIALGFLLASFGLVGLDGLLARRRRPPD